MAHPSAAPPAQYTGYPVQVYCFSGPLDLLLHLVRRQELEVAEVPVAEITGQYLDYLHTLQQVNVELSADFVVMAATLSHLKSRALLPPEPDPEPEPDAAEEEDPTVELERRLADYQVFKAAAGRLEQARQVRERIYLRPLDPEAGVGVGFVNLGETSLFDLVRAVGDMLKRAEPEPTGRVTLPPLTVPDRIEEVMLRLRTEGRELTFSDLVGPLPTRMLIIVTFLALLELLRRGELEARQEALGGELWVGPAG